MARSRNRPRRGLAWLIVLALALMILAATRVHAHAAPAPDDDEAGSDRARSDETSSDDAGSDPVDDPDGVDDQDTDDSDLDRDTDGRAIADDVTDESTATGLERAAEFAPDLDVDDVAVVDDVWLDPFGLIGTAAGDPSELRDIAAHHHRLSWFGRVDLTVVLRRRWRPATADAVAMAAVAPIGLAHTDTFLVLATWRK